LNEVRIEPFDHGFAAVIRGVDLARTLGAVQRETILDAWARHSILVFPDSPLTHEQLEDFTRVIGPFGEDPFVEPIVGHRHIIEVRREADETGLIFGGAWHSDWSFLARPPAATLLHAKVVPPVGGDTLFADGSRAYEALDEETRREVDSLEAIHSARFAYGPRGALAAEEGERGMAIVISDEAEEIFVHPLVRTHPVTGRKALFINPVYTVGLRGVEEARGRTLLKKLYAHMVEDRFVYRHKWGRDMLVLWDNRCVMHNAQGGYQGYRRLLHRTTVAGESVA
jgi:taurine dioxygenase